MTTLQVEPWIDDHGTVWELVMLGMDEVGGACLVRSTPSALDAADGDVREGGQVVARFADPDDGRAFLSQEGFEPMRRA